MPELPEVEAVCRKLRRDAVGETIASAHMSRHRDAKLVRAVRGRTIESVARRGKNILLALDGGKTVRIHLGMTGNCYFIPDARLRSAMVRAHFVLQNKGAVVLDDPRTLGRMRLLGPKEVVALDRELGVEPLSEAFTPEVFAAVARASRRPSKLFLMDQTRVVGLGNIYAAEALYRARVHPGKPMNRLSRKKLVALHAAIVEILRDAVESACNAYSGPGRFESGEVFHLAVYGREGEACDGCARRIRRIPQGGRSTYYCPGCQR